VTLLCLLAVPLRAAAIDEAERLWMVGERAVAEDLPLLAARVLERFVQQYPQDARVGAAFLLLGKARLALGQPDAALKAIARAQTFQPPPGAPHEVRLWQGEALFRLKRYAEAKAAYTDVLRAASGSALAADALYGVGWVELETKRPEAAAAAFAELLAKWRDHALAPAAALAHARTLIELKRYPDAVGRLVAFPTTYAGSPLRADAQDWLGVGRLRAGDTQAAVSDLRAFVDAHPAHDLTPAARRLLGETAARTGDRDRRAMLERATTAFRRKDWKEAATLATAAAATADDEAVAAEAWLLAGEAELKLKRFVEAVKSFEAVVEVKNLDASVRYRAVAGLGLAHEEQQAWKPALSAYETVASQSPDPALREWAKERAAVVKNRLPKSSM